LPDAFKQGSYASVNLLHYPVKNVLVGTELIVGERENNDGATGDDAKALLLDRRRELAHAAAGGALAVVILVDDGDGKRLQELH